VPNGMFLAGITRRRTIELLRADGYEVVERQMTLDDFDDVDEIFLTANASKITPVTRFKDRVLPEPVIAMRARQLYWDYAHEHPEAAGPGMMAVDMRQPGIPEVMRIRERAIPQPAPDEILIKIAYAGVNRPDVLQRKGLYAPPPGASDIPGLEASGTVVAIGKSVTRWKEGDAVCALLPGGGYAEFAVTPASHALPVPKGMTMAQAAGLPENYFTVWTNVFMRGGLSAGESILVHGGSSGIGTTAIQLANAFGARVFTTAGTDEKCRACMEIGAEQAINYTIMDFGGLTRDWTHEKGLDMILDMVGGSYIARNIKSLAVEGRLVMIAFLAGAREEIDFSEIMRKRLTVTGSTLRPQSVAAKARIAEALEREVWPLLESERIAPVMDHTFALKDVVNAHKRMERSVHIGKIVLKVS